MKPLARLTISRKLMALTLMVLIAVSIPSTLLVRQVRELATAAQSEIDGLVPVRQMIKLVQLTQHHRGLSAALLGGHAEVQPKRDAKNAEVVQQFEKLGATLKSVDMTEAMQKNWSEAQTQWSALSAAVTSKSLKASESSTQHAQLIAVYFKLLDKLVDQSGLILDPEADSYFLITAALVKLPLATEALGQARARGAGFLAEKQIGPDGRAMLAGLVQQASDHHNSMVAGFEKSFARNAETKRQLNDKMLQLSGLVEASLQLTRQELIAKDELSLPAPDYIASYTKTIDAMFVTGEATMDTLESVLGRRVADLRVTNALVVALVVGMVVGIFFVARSISRSITVPLQHAAGLAQQIAERDLRGGVDVLRQDEIGVLTTALLAMRDSLRGVIREVHGNSGEVALSAHSLAQGNNDLSQRTEQQASALEQTASSMEELTATVRTNADQAGDASKLALRACDVAVAGGESVDQITRTMGEIESSSRKIEEIIGVIDGIAFQTNILALNAAVEAARAGEQGRGFAVVATEVRALAGRSAEAAKQIKQLIATSVEQVDAGARLVTGAGANMHETVASIRSLSTLVSQISASSNEQSQGLHQISEAVSHMDQITQQNAALVEQTAAEGESLSEQAQRLVTLVDTFKMPA